MTPHIWQTNDILTTQSPLNCNNKNLQSNQRSSTLFKKCPKTSPSIESLSTLTFGLQNSFNTLKFFLKKSVSFPWSGVEATAAGFRRRSSLLFSSHNLSCKLVLPFWFVKVIVLVIRLLKFWSESRWDYFLNLIWLGCNFWIAIANLIHITKCYRSRNLFILD